MSARRRSHALFCRRYACHSRIEVNHGISHRTARRCHTRSNAATGGKPLADASSSAVRCTFCDEHGVGGDVAQSTTQAAGSAVLATWVQVQLHRQPQAWRRHRSYQTALLALALSWRTACGVVSCCCAPVSTTATRTRKPMAFGSAPAASKACMVGTWPSRAAYASDVNPAWRVMVSRGTSSTGQCKCCAVQRSPLIVREHQHRTASALVRSAHALHVLHSSRPFGVPG